MSNKVIVLNGTNLSYAISGDVNISIRQNISVQYLIPGISYHAVFGFLIPLLIEFRQTSVPNTNKPLFETHSTSMWIFLLAILIYIFSLAIEIKYKLAGSSCSQLWSTIAIVSGSIASISVVSMIIPPSSEYITFIAWLFVPSIVGYLHANSIKYVYNWALQKIYGIWYSFQGSSSMERPRLPV